MPPVPPPVLPPVLGLILAGGLARRMGGGDKPLRTLGGRTLLDRVVARLGPQCVAGLILNANGDPGRFPAFPGVIVPDEVQDNPGPLAGILAGLDHASVHHPEVARVVSVSGDAPFLPRDLVARLAGGGSPSTLTVAASGERQHFTVALWPVALRHDLREALVQHGERRVGAFLRRHEAVAVSWPAEPLDPFANINAPEDLAAAEAMVAAGEPD